jgi:hypothetical protein
MNYLNPPPPDAPNPMNYYSPSPLANQPRRIFGSFGDGSPIPANAVPPGLFADDVLGFDVGEMGEHGDPKRRRIARVRPLQELEVLYC